MDVTDDKALESNAIAPAAKRSAITETVAAKPKRGRRPRAEEKKEMPETRKALQGLLPKASKIKDLPVAEALAVLLGVVECLKTILNKETAVR